MVNAHEIIPGLFIGDEYSSYNKPFLLKNNITVIINCTNDVPFKFKRSFSYLRVPVDDSLKDKDIDKMTQFLPLVVEYLKNAHRTGRRNVLVHCHAGVQRSAIVVASYLLKYYKFKGRFGKPMEIVKFMISKRPLVFFANEDFGPSINFDKSYYSFYRSISRQRKKSVPRRK